VNISISSVDECCDGKSTEIGVRKQLFQEPGSLVCQSYSLTPIFSQIAHNDVDGNRDSDGGYKDGSLG